MILLEEICYQTFSLLMEQMRDQLSSWIIVLSTTTLTVLFEEAGVLLLFLSPYSLDYIPIGEAFSYIKAISDYTVIFSKLLEIQ